MILGKKTNCYIENKMIEKISFRSIEMLMYGVNGQIDRNDIRLY